MSGVTGLTLGKSKTERGTGDDLERQKVPHNDKSQLSVGAMHFLMHPCNISNLRETLFKSRRAGFPSEELCQAQDY